MQQNTLGSENLTRRYNSGETKRKAINAAVDLFLQVGFQHTTIRDICIKAGISSGSLFNVYKDKEAILYDLVVYMFSNQFHGVRSLLGDGAAPVFLYALETSLQLAMAEQDENIREIYVMAYTLPTTSAYIYRQTTKELVSIFGKQLPDFDEEDFYECEIGTANMMRGYMSVPCDEKFTLENKIRRFLDLSLAAYRVAPPRRQDTIDAVLRFDLRSIAACTVRSVVEWMQTDVSLDGMAVDGNLSSRISEFKNEGKT
jgi:AcrR family transcriptional regulator